MGQDAGVGWRAVPTPFGADLEAVTHAAKGPYAAGEGGILAASAGPNDWAPVIEQGALEAEGDLLAVDATRDGERVWFAGDSGVLGMVDTESGAAVGYDYTGAASATWTDLAVTGSASGERALLANDAGAVVSFDVEGEELSFSEPTRPSGTEIASLATTADGVGYAVDADGAVYTATPTGWVSLGRIDAEGDPTDITATADRISVSATDGHLYERPDDGDWSSTAVADESLVAVAADEQETVALAPSATFYTRPTGGSSWEQATAETTDRLAALALGPVDVAVGQNGAVVERGSYPDEGEMVDDTEPDLPPVDDGSSGADSEETTDGVAAIEDAENAIDDVDAAAADAANVADGAVEDAVEAVENAAADAQAAIEDAANAAHEPESMDEHTELVVEELLSRAETEDLIELLPVEETSDREFAEQVAELVERGGERHAHECDCEHAHGTHRHEHHHHHEHGGHVHDSRHTHGGHHHSHGGHDCC